MAPEHIATAGTPDHNAAERIAAGYATGSSTVALGSVVLNGQAHADAQVQIPLSMFNRHGLVAGATGTGKTKTLQLIAEQLSLAGVPVLAPDIKGDLTGLASPGEPGDKVTERAAETGASWSAQAFPVEYLSLAGQGQGIPLRATIDSFGPILLSKVLDLNETQESTLGLIFHWADQAGLPMLDLKDLRAVIAHLTSDEGKAELKALGGVSPATAGVILRAVTNLGAQGGDEFFGEPQWNVADLMRVNADGHGVVSLLEVAGLQTRPQLFSTFLMWLLAELFETLPEVGDVDKPKLVFLFDESHLLFSDASKSFLQAVEQTVKLIRSKGVGVFFCSQLPTDIPNNVLSQLGARIQHALRAFTPDDQKALKATVRTYPVTEDYDLSQALTSLGTGEAIVTVLSERGAPTPVAWTRMRPPRSLMAPTEPAAVTAAIAASPLLASYGTAVDRDSAYERLTARIAADAEVSSSPPAAPPPGGLDGLPPVIPTAPPQMPTGTAPSSPRSKRAAPPPAPTGDGGFLGDIVSNPAVGSFLKSFGTAVGGALGRSIFGTRSRSKSRKR